MEVPGEVFEQESLTNWLDGNNYKFSAIRNESDTHSFYKGKIRKRSGCRKGIPDFCIILKRGSLLFIELKRQRKVLKNGKLGASPSNVTDEQIEWQKELSSLDNIESLICYGAKEAIQKIKELEDF